ncbi:hypothetical protein [Fulvivirga ligni]|uniref:hypothetical protein n=1 Tax=Fulvivirga ligni TaxID=2904246 RepID=UPI001F18A186|nr:hypothetical protein [Fulvivirga ligni]UII20193.1 hypothetical protein LVD16_20310 [Fulvivirga ligni]
MKNILLTILLIIAVSIQAWSQTEDAEMSYTTETQPEHTKKSDRKYRYLDRKFIPETSMLRLGVETTDYSLSAEYLEYERKFGLTSSGLVGVVYSGQYQLERIAAYGGYRYFYNQKRKIEEGEQANNLIGSFVEGRVSRDLHIIRNYTGDPKLTSYSLAWGMQRRIGRYGYFGLSLGPVYSPDRTSSVNFSGYDYRYKREVKNRFDFNVNLRLAFAIGDRSKSRNSDIPYSKVVENRLSDFTNQLSEEKTMFKIGINNFDFQEWRYSMTNQIGVEHKIMPVLSIFAELDIEHRAIYLEDYPLNGGYVKLDGSVSVRYYYSLMKRMRLGKSGNNFSANYVALSVGDIVLKDSDPYRYNSGPSFMAQWGGAKNIWKEVLHRYKRRIRASGRKSFI